MFKRDPLPDGLIIRLTEAGDAPYLREWLLEPEVGQWFPMEDVNETEDAVKRWISLHRYKCSLTAVWHDVPCGIATLYLQPYRKLAHQSEFGIVVGGGFRNKGVGGHLLSHLMDMAVTDFNIELLHLQVYAGNPAIPFYERFGFREFGRQTHWSKKGNAFVGRIFMERFLMRPDPFKLEPPKIT